MFHVKQKELVMLKVGQIEQVEITGYSSEGMGVCRIDGCAVFVPNAIRGELCRVRVTHVSRNSAHGRIEEILSASPHRIRRACPAAKLCGGCQLHHMDYAEELAFKAQKVTDALNRIGGQSLDPVPITGGDGRRMQNEASGIRHQASGIRHQASGDGGCEASGISFQASGIRHQASGDGGCEASGERAVGAAIGRPPEEDSSDEASGIRHQASGDGGCEATVARAICPPCGRPEVILVDPPRKGLSPDVIEAIGTMAPQRVVYVSCDPATLARDVKLLTACGYALTHAEAFDLFPRTFHVETVVQLVRKNPDMTVCVTLNLEDADLTAAESKATYEQIKDYVLKTYGFQVTNLQIAQTKRFLNLPVGPNYNPSKKENHHVPQCPPEKEAAIREALIHFQMS